jgi:NAD-dependent deacetylase
MDKKRLVVLTGAGISAESGIATFRDSNGLWENHRVEDVASPEGWKKNPALVLEFYNQRRKNCKDALPNKGHKILHELEEYFEVNIITQNVDDLHERANSSSVLHLHGQLTWAKSSISDDYHEFIGYEPISLGQKAKDGSQLRPHIVWFGEAVPLMKQAIEIVEKADILLVVGTSLQVYPAAGLLDYAPKPSPVYVVDPNLPPINSSKNIHYIQKGGSKGLTELQHILATIC